MPLNHGVDTEKGVQPQITNEGYAGGESLYHSMSVDTQRAFPVYHRKLGNPAPLGLLSFATTTLILSLYNIGARGISVPNVVVAMAMGVGGLCQLLAGMWEFATGNTFGATAFSLYGGFWFSYGIIYLPSSGILGAYEGDSSQLSSALGIYLTTWTVVTFLMFMGTFKSSVAIMSTFFFVLLTFMILAVGQFTGSVGVIKAGGVLGCIASVLAFYTSAAGLYSPDASHFRWALTLPITGLALRITQSTSPHQRLNSVKIMDELTSASNDLRNALKRYGEVCSMIEESYLRSHTFSDVPREISDCAVVDELLQATSYETEIKWAKAAISHTRNSIYTTAAQSLPPEILAQIFQLLTKRRCAVTLTGRVPKISFPIYPDRLSHVCSRWRQVAIGTRALWMHIDLAPHHLAHQVLLDRAETYASRVGQSPLEIHIIGPGDGQEPFDDSRLGRFLVSNTMHIRSLNLASVRHPDDNDFCRSIFTKCFANREPGMFKRLFIDSDWTDDEGSGIFLEAAGNPLHHGSLLVDVPEQHLEDLWLPITTLRLNHIFPCWSSKAYHGLTELHLTSTEKPTITETQLETILGSSPGLRVFRFGLQITRIRPTSASVVPTRLSDLKVLHLHALGAEQLGIVLSLLAPGSKPLQISINGRSETVFLLDEVKQFFARSNVTRVDAENLSAYAQVVQLFNLTPHLRALALSNFSSRRMDKPENMGAPFRLDSLYLIKSVSTLDKLRRMLRRHKVRKLTCLTEEDPFPIADWNLAQRWQTDITSRDPRGSNNALTMPLSAPSSYTYLTLEARLKSFSKSKSKAWPHNSTYRATPDTLARAGFAFTPDNTRKSDRVTCFVCGKTLGGWEPADDPFKEHAEHSPACSWALARCSIEALRVSPESTDLVFPDEASLPSSATLEAARLATFGKFWPHDSVRSHSAKSKHMAKAGFIYTPTNESDDLASCFYCNLGLDGWESTDDPHHEHQRRRPHCAFFSAHISHDDEPEPAPESEPKRIKGKSTKKPQPSDLDRDDDLPLLPKAKRTITTIKRTASKSSKAAPGNEFDQVKPEPADGPPSTRGKLRKSQSHGQLQLGRSALGKSSSQPERSQSALGRSQAGRSQSQLGHSRTRSMMQGMEEDDDDDDEVPVVPPKAKPKASGKNKKAAPDPEPEESEPAPTRSRTKTTKKALPSEPEPEEEPGPDPKPGTVTKTKSGKGKPKPVPESEPEPPELEEDPAPVPAKAKTKGKAKTTKGKKATKKVIEDDAGSAIEMESAAEVEPESAAEADSAVEVEPKAAPKKTRAKKTTTATKKGTRGKKAKTKGGDETESQAEVDDTHMQSPSESEAHEPLAARTPRPPSRINTQVDESTPRAAAGANTSGRAGSALPIPSRLTPSPTRLPAFGGGARAGGFGTPKAGLTGTSQPTSAANTPKASAATGGSGIAKPASTTGIPRPGATTPVPAGPPRSGLHIRQPTPTRPAIGRPVFGAANRNPAGTGSSANVNATTDVVMASPSRPSRPASAAGTAGRAAAAPGSPTRPVSALGGSMRPLSAQESPKRLVTQVQAPNESSVPFPRESSPMTPGRHATAKLAPVKTTAPTASSSTAPTVPNGAPVDPSLVELDNDTRALSLEAYVRREMGIQYDALKAECEREIEEFLKAAKETRAKIAAL
ncbi:BIR domain-containing protein [Ceratobasidium theobromae]|uniref:BIR domain-containing protein n=1 Tax=Ceratobasidium theobromae TaxID=1582974 RepID=A0A5N5QBW9_9AGAM|nr:BIR domain-containing protein [Ceratobasidium theobromae]